MFEKLILFFLFFLPFQFALHPTEVIDLPLLRIGAVFLFLFWLIKGLLKKNISLPQPFPLFFFLAFLFWALLSVIWGENTEWALRKIFFLFSFFPLFLVFIAFLEEKEFQEKAVRYIVYGAILSAGISLFQFFAQFIFGVEKVFYFWTQTLLPFFLGPNFSAVVTEYPSLLVNISGKTLLRATGFFPDPHMFSFFLGMTFFLALSLAFDIKGKKRFYFVGGALILFLADLLTFSRGGYIGLIAGSFLFIFQTVLSHPKKKKIFLWSIFSCVFFCLCFFLTPIGNRLYSSFSPTDTSNKERLRLWQVTADFIYKNPVFGSGLGNYALQVKPTAGYREPIYAHNTYLDIAGELGIPGLFFFLSFLLLGGFSSWQRWKKEKKYVFLAVFSALSLFLVHAFFETPIFSVHVLPLLLFFLALGMYNTAKE